MNSIEGIMRFSFEKVVDDVRHAAGERDIDTAVQSVLMRYVLEPNPIIAATPEDGEDEIMLFQDQELSIWRCRFQPNVTMPPHDHKLPVYIAGYSGGEKNIIFKREDGVLRHDSTHIVKPGEVFKMDDDGIHAVVADSVLKEAQIPCNIVRFR
jgi:predicted metal-dependent enzyme (double-stranded beta helix superfamily)